MAGFPASRPRIIPAYAGSTPGPRCSGAPAPDHPRIRGEHIVTLADVMSILRIIPAYAGSTRARRRRCVAARDHPRIRGEHSTSR